MNLKDMLYALGKVLCQRMLTDPSSGIDLIRFVTWLDLPGKLLPKIEMRSKDQ